MLKSLFFYCICFCTFSSYAAGYELAEGVSPSLSYDKFMHAVQTTQAVTVEDFLKDWKQADPLVFRFYLLSFRSRSLQSATPQSPRAILFSPAADFVASFNGHSALRGSRNIEVIRFNHSTERFEFREVTFDLKNRPTVSEENPRKCLECHQSFTRADVDPRPNWEPYFMWPGFFGMTDGPPLKSEKHLTQAERERLDPSLDSIIFNETNHEEEWYNFFWSQIAPTDLRYSLLDLFNKDVGTQDAKLYGSHAARDLKTTMFTQRMAQVNFRRVARIMTDDKEVFNYLQEALIGVMRCGTRHFPETFLNWLRENSSISQEKNLLNLDLGDRMKLLFEPFYYDTDDWSMDFKTNARFAFSNRFGTPGRPDHEFSEVIAKKSKSYAALKMLGCDSKFTKRLEKYQDLAKAQALRNQRIEFKDRIEAIKNTPLINRCIRCHASPNDLVIPQISFDQPSQLKQELLRTGFKRGRLYDEIIHRVGVHAASDEQMPPQGLPTAQQRDDLIQYLKSLINERTDVR